jgi:serine/threonine protein kinase
VTHSDNIVHVTKDGCAVIDGKRFAIPNLSIETVIGRGKNGVVFNSRHRIINDRRAVKVWHKFRARDRRDKLKQGVKEILKLNAAVLDFVPKVFDAGVINGAPYSVMSFFDGVPLKEWLFEPIAPFVWRYKLAMDVAGLHSTLIRNRLIHGDFHWGNILVSRGDIDQCDVRSKGARVTADTVMEVLRRKLTLCVVDFGTSYFSVDDFSEARHWRVYQGLIDVLLQPVEIQRVWGHRRPKDIRDAHKMDRWISDYFYNMWIHLMHGSQSNEVSGLMRCAHPEVTDRHGMIMPAKPAELIVSRDAHAYLKGLYDSGALNRQDPFLGLKYYSYGIEQALEWGSFVKV